MFLSAEEQAEAMRPLAESLMGKARRLQELSEETERAQRRVEEDCRHAEDERQKGDKLAERLRSLGIDPDAV
jgi:hypothetical protein